MKECSDKDSIVSSNDNILDKFWKWLDDSFTWYQQKIGNYDKQTWEESVEQRILNKLERRPKNKVAKGTNVYNNTLIDVDVVGGAIYSKAKPQHGWLQILYRGVMRIVFMPFYYSFWKQQTSSRITLFMIVHYFLQCLQLKLFYDSTGDTAYSEEVFVPVLLLISLGVLHAQIISPQLKKSPQSLLTAKSFSSPKPHHRKRSRRAKHRSQTETERHYSSSEDGSSRGGFKHDKDDYKNNSSKGKETIVEPDEHSNPETVGQDTSGRSGLEIDDTGEEKDASSSEERIKERKKMKMSAVNDDVMTDDTRDEKSNIEKEIDFQNFIMAKNKKIPDPVDYQTSAHSSYRSSGRHYSCELNTSVDILPSHKLSYLSPARRRRNRHSSERVIRQTTDPSTTNGYHFESMNEPIIEIIPDQTENRLTRSQSPESVTSGHDIQSRDYSLRSFSVTGECPPDDSGIIDSGQSASCEISVLSTDMGKSASDLTMPHNVTGTLIFGETINTADMPCLKDSFEQKTKNPIQRQSSIQQFSDSEVHNKLAQSQEMIAMPPQCESASRTVTDDPIDGNPLHAFPDNSSDKTHKFTIGKYSSEVKIESNNNNRPKGELDIDETNKTDDNDAFTTHSKQKVKFQQKQMFNSLRNASYEPANPGDDSTGAESESAAPKRYLAVRSSGQKSQNSETEYDRMNSDVGSCGTSSATETGHAAEAVRSQDNDVENNGEDPFVLWYKETHPSGFTYQHLSATQTVSCYVWENYQLKKADLTLLDIGWSIIQAVERYEMDSIYTRLTFLTAFILSLNPLYYRIWTRRQYLSNIPTYMKPMPSWSVIIQDYPGFIMANLLGTDYLSIATFILGILLRMSLYMSVAFLLCVAERIFEQRLQYAKHFCHLTSSRRAKKYILPHFRLNKVRNIKFWLSLRSYFKKRGPQRSVDSIITAAFYLIFSLLSVFCANILQDNRPIFDQLMNWDLILSPVVLSLFLLRFLTLGTKITKKYRNFSILITEQINLYLAMETKPHKKDDLVLANNVLKLAEELLKEVDGPFKVCGWSINPLVYNIIKIVVLSACSAVLSEFLGFKLKLYKIKINPTNW